MSDISERFCEDFCQELAGSKDTSFSRTYDGEPASRIIAVSNNLTLMADLSPLSIGHLLLVSNYHYYSYAEVCRDHLDEVGRVTDQVLTLYSSTFGDPVILEHGSSPDASGGSSCISHAHWHFLPVSAERISGVMTEDGLKHTNLESLGELAQTARRLVPYLYVASASHRSVFSIDRLIRRQYLRSVVGTILGIPDPIWDWAIVAKKQYLRSSMRATTDWCFNNRID